MQKQLKTLVVGSFLAEEKRVFGGIAKSCQTMMQSSFSKRFAIIPIDSTQISNPPPKLIVRFVLAIRRMATFVRQLIRHHPDAVLLFASVGASFIEKCVMAWISRLLGYPVLIFPRGGKLINQATSSGFRRIIARVLLRGSRVFLAQGPKWRDFAITEMGFEPARVSVVSNWTATDRYLNIGSEREFKFINKLPRILFVGWLEEFKGVFELLNACQKLAEKGVKFNLTLAGRGHAEDEAKHFVKKNSLEEVVTFAGWAEADKLEELYSSNDIFVLPSWNEGMPNSMIEAMAAGLAVVVTTVGMVTDFLTDGKHALLIPPRDVELLEDALERILHDEKLRKNLSLNGHHLAKTQFSVEPAMKKLGDIIEDTIIG